jgi:hypothetical protein
MTLATLATIVGLATLATYGIQTVGLFVDARRSPPTWLRRRLGLKEGK